MGGCVMCRQPGVCPAPSCETSRADPLQLWLGGAQTGRQRLSFSPTCPSHPSATAAGSVPASPVRCRGLRCHPRFEALRWLPRCAVLQRGLLPCALAGAQGGVLAPAGSRQGWRGKQQPAGLTEAGCQFDTQLSQANTTCSAARLMRPCPTSIKTSLLSSSNESTALSCRFAA